MEICNKVIFQADLTRSENEQFGLDLEAELAYDPEREDVLNVFVSGVVEGSPAHRTGIAVGDELLTVNGQVRS